MCKHKASARWSRDRERWIKKGTTGTHALCLEDARRQTIKTPPQHTSGMRSNRCLPAISMKLASFTARSLKSETQSPCPELYLRHNTRPYLFATQLCSPPAAEALDSETPKSAIRWLSRSSSDCTD